MFGATGSAQAEAATARAAAAFVTVTTVGNVKNNRSPGALLVTISRSTLETTVQRYAVRAFAPEVVSGAFDDALADAGSNNAAPNAAGTTTSSHHAFTLLSLASQISLNDIVCQPR